MGCDDCLASSVELCKSTCVLIGATLLRLVMFMVYLSASIGPAVFISRAYGYFTGLEPMPDIVESAICMLFVSCWAEFSIDAEKYLFGATMQKWKNKHPTTMTLVANTFVTNLILAQGRFTVHIGLYMYAFCEMYAQFELSHTVSERETLVKSRKNNPWNSQTKTQEKFELSTNSNFLSDNVKSNAALTTQRYHTALFLLLFAYLVFITSKNLYQDVMYFIRHLPIPAVSMFNNCMVRIGFAIIHFGINVVCFIPCIGIAYSVRAHKYAGNLTYFQLNFTACLCGMIAAFSELNKPFPQRRGQLPYLYVENSMIGKSILAHVHIIFILIAYYRPFNHTKVEAKHFDSVNDDLMYFCLSVAFTVLHIVKYGTYTILTLADERDPFRNRMQDVIENPDIVENDAEDRGSGGNLSGTSANVQAYSDCSGMNDSNANLDYNDSANSCESPAGAGNMVQLLATIPEDSTREEDGKTVIMYKTTNITNPNMVSTFSEISNESEQFQKLKLDQEKDQRVSISEPLKQNSSLALIEENSIENNNSSLNLVDRSR